MLAAPAAAQVPDLGDLGGLRRSLQAGETPLELNADQMSYSREQDMVTAEGHVRLSHGAISLTADRALYYRGAGRVKAEGHLSARDGDDTLSADSLDLDLLSRSGVITNGRFFLAKDQYHLTGERIERRADGSYRFERAILTSCEETGGRMPWKIRARSLRVEPEQYLTARGVVFSVLDVPVIYLPYLLWPVKTERQSGLLTPQLGYSTGEGLKIRQPLFLTLGPSHDMTVTVDERTGRGVGGELEYRYKLSRRSSGTVDIEVFSDRDQDRVRSRVTTSQAIAFNDRLELRLSGEYVSDSGVLRDLHTQTADRTRQFVESNALLAYHDGYQTVTALTRYTRDLANPDDAQTQLLPQVQYRLPSLAVAETPLFIAMQASYTNFWTRSDVSTRRADAFPVLVWRQAVPFGLVVTPRVGFRETVYRGDDPAGGAVHVRRELGVAGLGLSTSWAREFAGQGGGRVRHAIEPVLLYTYAGDPRNEPDKPAPQFDEIDEFGEQNLVTAGLTNRVTSSGAGGAGSWEPLWVRLSQTFRFSHRPSGAAWSALRGEAVIRTQRALQLEIDSFYDHARGRLVAFDTEARLLIGSYGDVELGRRSTRPTGSLPRRGDLLDPLAMGSADLGPRTETDYYTVLAHAYLPGGFVLANKTYYNRQDDSYTEIDYGLLYKAQCWSVTLTYQVLPDRNEFGVMFTLVGGTGADSKAMSGLFDRLAP